MSRIVNAPIEVFLEDGAPVRLTCTGRSVSVRVADAWRLAPEWHLPNRNHEEERDYYRLEAVAPQTGLYLVCLHRRTQRWVLEQIHD